MHARETCAGALPTRRGCRHHRAAALLAALGLAATADGAALPLHLEFSPSGYECADGGAKHSQLWALDVDADLATLGARDASGSPDLTMAYATATPGASSSPAMPALSAFPRRIWDDLLAFVVRPLHFDGQDWTRLGLGTAAVGVTAAFDERVQTYVQEHSTAGSRDLANRLRPLGSWQGTALMVALLGVGELAGNANVAATGADGIEATLFATGLVTPFIQTVGRERPSAEQGPHSFQPFSGAASFPSGEVTQAFALASVVTAHTDSVVLRSVVWGLAGLVGWERIELDRHWASDVVAGALIGSAVGRWVVRRQEPSRRAGVVWGWQPIVGPRRFGVHVAASW